MTDQKTPMPLNIRGAGNIGITIFDDAEEQEMGNAIARKASEAKQSQAFFSMLAVPNHQANQALYDGKCRP